ICRLLQPDKGEHYGIELQAEMQLQSILLAAAGLTRDTAYFQSLLEHELGISENSSVVFQDLQRWLFGGSIIASASGFIVIYSCLARKYLGASLPYVIELCSLLLWQVGAIGLLALGGTPRVRIVRKPIAQHIESRLPLQTSAEKKTRVEF